MHRKPVIREANRTHRMSVDQVRRIGKSQLSEKLVETGRRSENRGRGERWEAASSECNREREQVEERGRLLSHLGLSFSFCCGTFWRLTAQPMTAGFSDHPVVPGPRDRRFAFRRDSHLYFLAYYHYYYHGYY